MTNITLAEIFDDKSFQVFIMFNELLSNIKLLAWMNIFNI